MLASIKQFIHVNTLFSLQCSVIDLTDLMHLPKKFKVWAMLVLVPKNTTNVGQEIS